MYLHVSQFIMPHQDSNRIFYTGTGLLARPAESVPSSEGIFRSLVDRAISLICNAIYVQSFTAQIIMYIQVEQ